jgi:hypothetical protein
MEPHIFPGEKDKDNKAREIDKRLRKIVRSSPSSVSMWYETDDRSSRLGSITRSRLRLDEGAPMMIIPESSRLRGQSAGVSQR